MSLAGSIIDIPGLEVERVDRRETIEVWAKPRFRQAPNKDELEDLVQLISQRVGLPGTPGIAETGHRERLAGTGARRRHGCHASSSG